MSITYWSRLQTPIAWLSTLARQRRASTVRAAARANVR